MAISRSLMNRQLRANGGIMDVTPRENFGLGSSLKKFVRKIIPNEVAEIATKAAPFVAPFNPALAAGMSGLGTFDQTGSISAGLKAGAMNYGGGQLARYAGGAGFQGNPFGQGGAFTQGGFQSGFSSPLGNETGLGKFFSKPNAPVSEIQSIGTTGDASIAEQIAAQGRAVNAEQTGLFTEGLTGGAETITDAVINKTTVAKEPGFLKNMFDGISNQDYGKVAQTIGDGAKKFGKAMFTNKDGSIDKAAVMGAIAFAGSYAEALALAEDAGVELTEETYDEARKVEKKEEYAGYLTNFFGGQKDGGRIGYEGGANELIMEKLKEDIMPDTSTEEMIMIMTDDGPKMIKRSDYEAMPGMFRDTTTSLYGDAARGRPVPEFANGGRIGYARGTPDNTTMFEELNTDTIYRPEPESTITLPEEMPGDDRMAGVDGDGFNEDADNIRGLAEIYMQEGMSESDAYSKAVGEIYEIDMSKFKKGGRVNRRFGSPEEGERSGVMEMLSVDVDAGGDEEEENMTMAYEPGSFKKDKFKPMEIDAINERLQTFLDMEGGGLPLPLVGTVKGIANTLKAGKAVFTGPEKTTIIRNLAGRSRGTNAYKELGKSIPEAKRIMDNPIDYLKDAAIFKELLKGIFKKDGGRIGLKDGTGSSNRVAQLMLERDYLLSKDEDVSFIDLELERDFGIQMKAEGGIMEAKVPTGQMRKNNAGVAERDYRQTGGFVPVGIKERADDVPAMLSKNEFVMTADAVRGLGNGSVEEGSKKLYNTMKQAEQVGKA